MYFFVNVKNRRFHTIFWGRSVPIQVFYTIFIIIINEHTIHISINLDFTDLLFLTAYLLSGISCDIMNSEPGLQTISVSSILIGFSIRLALCQAKLCNKQQYIYSSIIREGI